MSEKSSAKQLPSDGGSLAKFELRDGPSRPYIVTEPPKEFGKLRTVSCLKERFLVVVLFFAAAAVRLWALSKPDSVVFDEVHFGKFAAKYIKGIFFTDVHPPLAKMLFAGVASLAGFNGDFEFEQIGDIFPETTPYYVMRLFSASLGLVTVVLLYLTLRASGIRIWIAFVCALAFAVENSFVTISRYILLDSPLIFFIAAAVYSYKKYEIYPSESFQAYKALFACALALGLAVSSKWVGLFTIAWVGVLSILKIWFEIGDLSKPVSKTLRHSFFKALILLATPAIVYLAFFHIHFNTLTINSDGSGFFSSAFRRTLVGNNIPENILKDVGFGSVITLRHTGSMGGYLHSHNHFYETGSKQQQITLYPHLDGNNQWLVQYYDKPFEQPTSFEALTDGTKIKLQHQATFHRLHSHDHKPPVSEFSDWQKEVSAYGGEGFEGDGNDDWVIEIDVDQSTPGEAQERIIPIHTKFRLRHAMTGCLLFSHEVKLPAWGFEQQEVTCASSAKPYYTLWYVEGNENPLLPRDAVRVNYPVPTFWEKLLESHQKMWHINNNLKEHHIYQSDPITWPFLLRGISYWAQDHKQIYLLGNAVMWWLSTAIIGVFALVVLGELLAWQFGKQILQDSDVINYHLQTFEYILGWLLHYAPSFLMGRQLFLHHYLPAYYFAILAIAHCLELCVSYIFRKRKMIGYGFVFLFLFASGYFFYTYKSLAYGEPWTKDLCLRSQLVGDWDYSCGTFLNSYEEYTNLNTKSHNENAVPSNTMIAGADSDPTGDPRAPPDPVHVKYESINPFENEGPKRFVDQHGNELSEEVAKEILQQGGKIESVEVIKN